MEEQPDRENRYFQDADSGGSCDGWNEDKKNSSGNTDPSSCCNTTANETEEEQAARRAHSRRDVESSAQQPEADSDSKLSNQGNSVSDKAKEALGGPLLPARTSSEGEKSAMEEEMSGMEQGTKEHVDRPSQELDRSPFTASSVHSGSQLLDSLLARIFCSPYCCWLMLHLILKNLRRWITSDDRSRRDVESSAQQPEADSDSKLSNQGNSVSDKAKEALGGPLLPARTSSEGEKSAMEEEMSGMEQGTKEHVDRPSQELDRSPFTASSVHSGSQLLDSLLARIFCSPYCCWLMLHLILKNLRRWITSDDRSRRDVESSAQQPEADSDSKLSNQGNSVSDKAKEAMGGPLLKVLSVNKPRKYMGLCNQGSTCYLNSLLQCLFFTQELRQAIRSYDNTDPGILHSLKKLFQEMDGEHMPTTTGITTCLGIRNVHQQQDVEEYFRRLMDKIIEEKEDIRQLYEVKKVHTITCCKCGLQTKVENPALSLSLSFKKLASNHAGYSVASALDEIQQENTFTGDDQLYCETCKCKQDATSKYYFGSLPPILVLHLKRYQFDFSTGFTKLSCEVSVPLSLNMDKEDHTVHYDLYAMCHHFGEIQGGHYRAEIKPFEDDCWYEFDDSRVRQIGKEEISSDGMSCMSTTAYLLMYQRRVDPSAGSATPQPVAASMVGRGAEEQDGELEKQQNERLPVLEGEEVKKMPLRQEGQRKCVPGIERHDKQQSELENILPPTSEENSGSNEHYKEDRSYDSTANEPSAITKDRGGAEGTEFVGSLRPPNTSKVEMRNNANVTSCSSTSHLSGSPV